MVYIDDYIRYEDIDEEERQKYVELIMQYKEVREYLSTKKVFNKKNYGIWFDYDQLDKDTAE